MPNPPRSKYPAHQWFIQDWGTLPSETLVVVGLGQEQIVKEMRRCKFQKHIPDEFEKATVPIGSNGWMWFMPGTSTVLGFNEWELDWEHVNTLIHETNHMVFNVFRDRGMEEEMEAQAYQQEYLFDRIRRRLCAKKKGKK